MGSGIQPRPCASSVKGESEWAKQNTMEAITGQGRQGHPLHHRAKVFVNINKAMSIQKIGIANHAGQGIPQILIGVLIAKS